MNLLPKRILFIVSLFATALTLSAQSTAYEGDVTQEPQDKTLSPYLQIKGSDSSLDSIPLKSTDIHVDLAGLFASVKVKQVYANKGTKPIEAIYVFPGSTRAAVHAMRLTVGEQVTEAEIKEKGEARQTYETAKQEGKTASLLEQHRPNVFQMSVATILPGDLVTVEMEYSEFIVPEEGRYQFTYPGVVGPRYNSPHQAKQESWTANPYLGQGEPDVAAFTLDVSVATPVPLADLRCPTHKPQIQFTGEDRAQVTLPASENGSNRDFILEYRLTSPSIETGIITAESAGEQFFLMMVQPPARVPAAQVLPRDYLFILDVSGSMHGFPINVAKTTLRQLVGSLREADTFNLLLFSGGSNVYAPNPVRATTDNLRAAIKFIDNSQAGGGTELLPALKHAYSLPKAEENTARSIVILTDGYVSVEDEAFAMVRQNLSTASVYAFGIGNSVNRHLIEGLARAGMGEPFVVINEDESTGAVEQLRKYLESPVLTGLKLEMKGVELYDVEGALADVLAERPVVICGKWKGAARGSVKLEALGSGEKPFSVALDMANAKAFARPEVLRRFWARLHMQTLYDRESFSGDRDHDVKGEIIKHSLGYGLLSQYTAFVAVNPEVRNPGGQYTSVKQPLPLPQGVSNYALGNGTAIPTTPEPADIALFCTVLVVVIGVLLYRRHKQRDLCRGIDAAY
ncbi:MAG: VIT and VWA domain-containing protein [Verrucomicrobiota bacterium]|nr:VIT and VWA domain-containing protein [Verrucomicrobiota bacterium]